MRTNVERMTAIQFNRLSDEAKVEVALAELVYMLHLICRNKVSTGELQCDLETARDKWIKNTMAETMASVKSKIKSDGAH